MTKQEYTKLAKMDEASREVYLMLAGDEMVEAYADRLLGEQVKMFSNQFYDFGTDDISFEGL